MHKSKCSRELVLLPDIKYGGMTMKLLSKNSNSFFIYISVDVLGECKEVALLMNL